MTPLERDMARALGRCRIHRGTWSHKFASDMYGLATGSMLVTEKQVAAMLRLVHTFRRQLPAELVDAARILSERVSQGELFSSGGDL